MHCYTITPSIRSHYTSINIHFFLLACAEWNTIKISIKRKKYNFKMFRLKFSLPFIFFWSFYAKAPIKKLLWINLRAQRIAHTHTKDITSLMLFSFYWIWRQSFDLWFLHNFFLSSAWLERLWQYRETLFALKYSIKTPNDEMNEANSLFLLNYFDIQHRNGGKKSKLTNAGTRKISVIRAQRTRQIEIYSSHG